MVTLFELTFAEKNERITYSQFLVFGFQNTENWSSYMRLNTMHYEQNTWFQSSARANIRNRIANSKLTHCRVKG